MKDHTGLAACLQFARVRPYQLIGRVRLQAGRFGSGFKRMHHLLTIAGEAFEAQGRWLPLEDLDDPGSPRRCPSWTGTPGSIFLLAVGAILTFAVNVNTSGSSFDLDTVGIILMLAGALGLLFTLVFWSSFSPWSRRRRQVIDRSYDGDRVVEERRIRRDVP